MKDFTPIARGGNLPFILVANPKRPWKTVADLVADARQRPAHHLCQRHSTGIVAGATLARRANIDILHVPYKGTPQGLTDVVGGQVDFMFTDLASGLPFVQSGQLQALAVSTAQRSAIVPDLPSMAESGVPDFDLNSWNGYFGPAGLPPGSSPGSTRRSTRSSPSPRPASAWPRWASTRSRARRRTSPASWASSATCGAS